MTRITRQAAIFRLVVVLSLLMTAQGALADIVNVAATVAPTGEGRFHWEISVTTDLFDLLLVTITDAPSGDALIESTIVGPPGFKVNYDAGFIDLLADSTPYFLVPATSGFSFDSNFGPANNFRLFTAIADFPFPEYSGAVEVTQVETPVPEPASSPLLAIGLGLIALGASRAGRSE